MNWKILLAFALFLGLAIALSLAAATFPVLPFDVKIGQELGKERNPIFASLMQGVSEIGRPEVATPLIVGTAATLALLRRWLEAFFVLATATGVALAILLKVVVARPRPMPDAGNDLLGLFNQYGFPSGHVVFFVVFFGFVAYLAYSQLAGPPAVGRGGPLRRPDPVNRPVAGVSRRPLGERRRRRLSHRWIVALSVDPGIPLVGAPLPPGYVR
ncbi:MAG: hypothetical protein M1380_10715 [Chloroflexi bacterium]|nr:hypothetical protein [Chloroflexota bacterium]